MGFDPQLSEPSQLTVFVVGLYQYVRLSCAICGSAKPCLNALMYGTAKSSMAVWSSPSAHLLAPSSVCAEPYGPMWCASP